MKKILIFTMTLLITGFITAQEQEAARGRKLPSVNVKTLEGQTFNTQNISNDGKPIILSFWALWCKPCKRELDTYNDNYEDWKSETGVKIIAVSIDDSRSTAKVLPFVNGKDWEFEVLLDPNGDFKRAMSVNMIPHTFILDGEGNIVYQHTSYYEGLEDEIFEIVEKVAAGEDVSSRK
ncbi:MAG: TlpA family protein disulfide reductase [Proteobacteria bacterium]|nr:TlpA family protein disulfide reductase [Pseudomonadota bacterium]